MLLDCTHKVSLCPYARVNLVGYLQSGSGRKHQSGRCACFHHTLSRRPAYSVVFQQHRSGLQFQLVDSLVYDVAVGGLIWEFVAPVMLVQKRKSRGRPGSSRETS